MTSTKNVQPTDRELELVFSCEKDVYKEEWFPEFLPILVKLNTAWNLEMDKLYKVMSFESFKEQFESEDDQTRQFLFDMLEPHCPTVIKFFTSIMQEAEPEKVIDEYYDKIVDDNKLPYAKKIENWFNDQIKASGGKTSRAK